MPIDKRPEVLRRRLDWCKNPLDGEEYADRFCLLVARFFDEDPEDLEAWARDLLTPEPPRMPFYFIGQGYAKLLTEEARAECVWFDDGQGA